jgi:hypothetical protein
MRVSSIPWHAPCSSVPHDAGNHVHFRGLAGASNVDSGTVPLDPNGDKIA